MKSYRKDGKIYIEIPEDDLLFAATCSRYLLKVTDKEKFLNYFVNNVLTHGDSGDFDSQPAICSLFDNIVEMAQVLDEGIEEDCPNE